VSTRERFRKNSPFAEVSSQSAFFTVKGPRVNPLLEVSTMTTGLLSKLTSILAYHDNVSIVILGDQWSTGLGFDGPTKTPAHGRIFTCAYLAQPMGSSPRPNNCDHCRRPRHPTAMALEIRYVYIHKRASEGANEPAHALFCLHQQSASYATCPRQLHNQACNLSYNCSSYY
jgi:hypothetical protein